MGMKYFIITIDTEGDNLWRWKQGDKIFTENVLFLNRFQDLCNTYGFKPVWLSNYEMISDNRYCDFIRKVESENKGELGMHLHAWNSPPVDFELPVEQDGAPYLIEYPEEIMEKKISYITDYIFDRTGIVPVSHRAGRWAMNHCYYELLSKYGYLVDCSVTPHINWSRSLGQTKSAIGSDYSHSPEKPYFVKTKNGIIAEVPVTVRRIRKLENPFLNGIRNSMSAMVKGKQVWMRPNGKNLEEMLLLIDRITNSSVDYCMFMLHSSELMPGGSPKFSNNEQIDKLYSDLNVLFKYASSNYRGITLRDYAKMHISDERNL